MQKTREKLGMKMCRKEFRGTDAPLESDKGTEGYRGRRSPYLLLARCGWSNGQPSDLIAQVRILQWSTENM